MFFVPPQGEIVLAADEARVSMTLEVERKTAVEARDEAAKLASAVQTAILDIQGVEKESLKTISLSVSPRYESIREKNNYWKQIIVGYVVRNSFEVKVNDADTAKGLQIVGNVVDTAIQQGGDPLRVNNVWFGLSRKTRQMGEVEARRLAAENAKVKAEAYAQSLDSPLGQVLLITEETNNVVTPTPMFARAGVTMDMAEMVMDEGVESTPIASGGERTIRANVYVTWELCSTGDCNPAS